MKKVIRLTENDLTRIVKRVIKEERLNELGGMDDSHPIFGDKNLSDYSSEELDNMLRGKKDSYQDESSLYNQLRDDVTYFLMDEGYNGEEISTMDLMDLMDIVEDIYNTTEDLGKQHHIEQIMADYEHLVDMDNDLN